MKIKLLNIIILPIVILPSLLLGNLVLAQTSCGGQCIDTNTQSCSVALESGKCPGGNNIKCCTGTVSTKSSSSSSSGNIELVNPLKTNSIPDLIDRIVTYLITIATIIFPLVIIYGAWQLLSTGGDVERAIMGRKTITYAVIGYVLILVSKGITMIIAEILGAK